MNLDVCLLAPHAVSRMIIALEVTAAAVLWCTVLCTLFVISFSPGNDARMRSHAMFL